VNEVKIGKYQKGDYKYEPTENPTYGEIITFEQVELTEEPLLWPLLVIEVRDSVSAGLFKKDSNV